MRSTFISLNLLSLNGDSYYSKEEDFVFPSLLLLLFLIKHCFLACLQSVSLRAMLK